MEEKTNSETNSETPANNQEQMIPHWRFKQETEKLKNEIDSSKEELFNLRATVAQAAQREAELAAKEQEYTTKFQTIEEDKTLFKLGFQDDSATEVARFFHGKIQGDNKPSIVDWVSSLKEDPSKAPIALQAYLNQSPSRQVSAPVPNNANAVTEKPGTSTSEVDIKKMTQSEYLRWKQEMATRFANQRAK